MSNIIRGEKPTPDVKAAKILRLELAQLLQGGHEAIIVHNGEDYRLRLTAKGKLILTK